MRDSNEVLEPMNDKNLWGSQGQPEVFPSNAELITAGFTYFLDYLSLGTEEAKARAGLAAKERYCNSTKPMWYHLI